MSRLNDRISAMSQRAKAATAIALLAIGAVGGASAASLTRPGIEMAPAVPTPVSRLSAATGIVSVKGRVAEVYGDRFIIEDSSGRMMIDAGRDDRLTIAKGDAIGVQGRYDDGQLRASFITDASGQVEQVGPRDHGRHHRLDGPPPPGEIGADADPVNAPPAPAAPADAAAVAPPPTR
ncbi:hypothetical protein [Sphingopyxis sp.]|uniref:hypothetical protein n=1 Tax=Sphingopyxis sp. TaxID=1908224 RepID=UPI003D0A6A67